MGIDSDITITECIDSSRVDLIPGKLAVAVCFLDGIRNLCRERRGSNIRGSGKNGVQLIILCNILQVQVLYLRRSVIVAVVCFQADDTILILIESIRTGTERLGNLFSHGREIPLRESELVLIIVELRLIAVVMQSADGECQLINHLRIYLGGNDSQRILAGLLNTRNVRCGLSGLYTDLVIIIARHQSTELGSGTL